MPRTARMGPKRLAMPRTSRTGPSYLVEARTDPGWHALPRSLPAEARNACSGGHRSWGCAAGRRCSVVGDGLGDQSRRLGGGRSEEHTSELQSLMRNSYAVFCLKKTNKTN